MSKAALPSHGNTVYDWPRWTDGKVHRARRGKDFSISAASFARSVHKHASNHGLSVTTRVKGEWVTFQFSKEG